MLRRSLIVILSLGLAGASLAQGPQKPQDTKQNMRKEVLKAELFIAITHHDVGGVKNALARGADPNSRNWLEMTPVQWAAVRGNRQVMDALLAKGGDLNAKSIYGSALTFAEVGRNPALAVYIVDRGADPNPPRVDNASPLMMAASNGHTELIARLLKKKCDVNKKDTDGSTALIWAARNGQTAAAVALLKGGANISSVDSHGRTALMYAAMNGQSQTVDALLAHKAALNGKDKRGYTPLLLACRYNGDPTVIRSLLKAGADRNVKDEHGQSPLVLCATRRFEDGMAAFHPPGGPSAVSLAPTAAPTPTVAIQRSLKCIQGGMQTFADHVKCSSCHHQGLGLMALGSAARHKYQIDGKLLGTYLTRLGEEGKEMGPGIHMALSDKNFAKTIPAVDIADISIGGGYLFSGLSACGIPSNPGLAEVAMFQVANQEQDGHWGFGINREPIQSSNFTTTALSLSVLRSYGGDSTAIQTSRDKAKKWLLTHPAANSEDKAARLLGLIWAGAPKVEMYPAIRELVAAQRPEGGWSQLPSMRSDAYATGMALYALKVTPPNGGPTDGPIPDAGPAIEKALNFLLRTQDEDGSWYVNKRTMPANTYFDAGFPHGESQYISFGATCWATMALIECTAAPNTASR